MAGSLGLRSILGYYRRYSGFVKGFMGFGCLMVLNISFTYLWELCEFDLYSYLGNSHVLVPWVNSKYVFGWGLFGWWEYFWGEVWGIGLRYMIFFLLN